MNSTQVVKRIGLFGGSFDPPHTGHVALVEAALERLHLDEVLVVPVGVAVHRNLSGRTTPEQRLDWMRRIFAGMERVRVLDWEVRESSPTPSIVTLRRLQLEQPGVLPVMLLGADAFACIETWVDYPAHAELCDVAVFGRVGSIMPEAATAFATLPLAAWLEAPAAPGHRVDVDVLLPGVSATEIRRMAAGGQALTGLVSACVQQDIEQAYAQAEAEQERT